VHQVKKGIKVTPKFKKSASLLRELTHASVNILRKLSHAAYTTAWVNSR